MLILSKQILREHAKDNDYFVKNYTLEERINYLNELNNDAIFDINNQYKIDFLKVKMFTTIEATNIFLAKISNIDFLNINNNILDIFIISNLDENAYKIFFEKCEELISTIPREDSNKLIKNISFIISHISNESIQVEYFNKFIFYYMKDAMIDFICFLNNDLLKLELMNKYEDILDTYDKIEIICSLSNDDLKIEQINIYQNIFSENDIVKIVNTINNDKYKLRLIEKFSHNKNIIGRIICSLNEDKLKLEMLIRFKDNFNTYDITKIISSLKSDDIKIKSITEYALTNTAEKRVIATIKNTELKLNIMIKYAIKNHDFNYIHNTLCINEELTKCETINYDLIKFYAEKNNLNFENLKILVEKFGYIILKYYQNKNILKLINSNKETFSKVLTLFTNEEFYELDTSTLYTVYDLIVKRIFRINNENNIFNLFEEIKGYAINKDKDNLRLIFKMIESSELIDFSKKEIDINNLIANLVDDNHIEQALQIVRNIIEEYLIKKRNLYFENRKVIIDKDLNLEKKYEKNYLFKQLLENLDEKTLNILISLIESINQNKLNDECKNLINNKELLLECLKFKNNPTNYKGDLTIVRKYVKTLNVILEILYNTKYDELNNCISTMMDINKSVYDFHCKNNEMLIKILLEIDIDVLKTYIFSNEFIFKELKNVLAKYKILGWNNIFDKILNEANIEYDEQVIASLIQYFYKIYPTLDKKVANKELPAITLLNILDETLAYESSSNVYRILLGNEDYNYIRINPSPFSAPATKEKRLKEIPNLIKEMYQKEFITIPPLQENIHIQDNKSLNVTIGNTTNTINLTYGERTAACMRIHGAADSLLRFCATNEFGFHVMITNPENHNLVSRVSGFRNGNTVFLNQLRDSLDKKYNAEDLIIVIKKVAKLLIEKTKDCKYPINNVIISPDYAMSKEDDNNIVLDKEPNSGYENLYTDIKKSRAILLASSNEDDSLVNLDFDKSKVLKYPVLRQNVKYLTDVEEINILIQKLTLINGLLLEEKEWMNPKPFNQNITKLLAGEDWYIALDEDNTVVEVLYLKRNMQRILEEIKEQSLYNSEIRNGEKFIL